MNWRKILVSLAVAAGLSLTLVAPASARPWFWDHHHDAYQWHHDRDRAGWFNHWRYDRDGNRYRAMIATVTDLIDSTTIATSF
jgi:hypothetical protein